MRMNGRNYQALGKSNADMQRRYTLKAIKLFVPALALLVALTLGGIVQAQPISTPASGCKEGAVLTTEQTLNPVTGGFTIDRTITPGEDTTVVLGAWTIVDSFAADPAVGTLNCGASPGDGNPLYVTNLTVKPVSGDPVRVGVKRVSFWIDNDLDGFFTPGKDIQAGPWLDGACLTSPQGCQLSFGNTPIFNSTFAGGPFGLDDTTVATCTVNQGGVPVPLVGVGGAPTGECGGIILVAEIENPQAGATLQVRLEGFASDIVNLPNPFSSDFSPSYKKQASNTRVVVQGSISGIPGILSPGVNNGSGNPETGVLGISTMGIRTRDDRGGLAGTLERDARPGDREYFVGIVGLCEAGDLVTPMVTLLPPIAGASPTIAGGLGAIPCIPTTAGADANPTSILRIRVGVSGTGAQWIQAVHIYADTSAVAPPAPGSTGWAFPAAGTTAATLFETGEMVLSAIPISNVAQVGSLEQVLTTSGGTPLSVATGPGNPAALLYVTVDIDDRAQASEVKLQVAVDVGDVIATGIPGLGGHSSRLLRTAPQEFNFKISGPPAPPIGVKQFDTNNNGVIDDPEFFTAIDQWVAGRITDALFFQVLDAWVAQTPITSSSVKGLSLKAVELSASANALTFAASGQGITSMGVKIYDLSGRTIFAQETPGTRLIWNLSANGQPVANGVYLYMVTVRGADGQILTTEVKKLVVLR